MSSVRKRRKTIVLKEVNRARVEMGLCHLKALPRGQRNNCLECPIARALTPGLKGIAVRAGEIRLISSAKGSIPARRRIAKLQRLWPTANKLNKTADSVKYPHSLSAFIRDFDAGKYPELVR